MKVSIFKGLEKSPVENIKLTEFFKRIKNGHWSKSIAQLRSIKDDKAQKKFKLSLSSVTLCGTCKGRNIEKSSGFIGIDVDAQDNAPGLLKKIPALMQDPFIHAIWRSSRGNGLWLLFKINHRKHLESFYGIESYLFNTYNIVADSQCKDNSRLCFVSHDPDVYYAHGKKTFTRLGEAPKIPGPSDVIEAADPVVVKALTKQIIESKKDIAPDYQAWLRIGFVYAELGEKGRALFHQCSQFHLEYDRKSVDLQFNKCLKEVAINSKIQGSPKIGTGTLVHYMKKAHINPKIVAGKKSSSREKISAPNNKVDSNVVYASQMLDEGAQTYSYGLLEFKLVGKNDFKCTGASVARTAEWLYKNGIRSHGMKTYYQIDSNIVREIFPNEIYNMVFLNIKNMPKHLSFLFNDSSEPITKDTAMAAAQLSIKKVVDAIPIDTSFDPDNTEQFLHDTKDSTFLKFKNTVVEVTRSGIKEIPYSKIHKLIWKRSIKDFEFKTMTGKSDVEKILDRAIDPLQRKAYMSAIGYMISTYFPPAGVPMLFCCDLNLEEGVNNGGNGKDFIKQIIAQVREVVTIPSRSLDLKREFALHTGNKDTEVFWFEDLNRSTRMDAFYNFSSNVPIRRLHTQSFNVQAKIGVSLQHAIDMEGTSNTRRQIFLLFGGYFGKLKQGIASEYGQVFGAEWPLKQRLLFNKFIVDCCQLYLKEGVQKMPLDKLIAARKDELGDELYSQLKLNTPYTGTQAMDAVQRGGLTVDELSQKMFISRWRKWCEHMDYDLVKDVSHGSRTYTMKHRTNLKMHKGGKSAS